ncbi:MAG: TrkA family potassium uptake protein [bacterium]
MYVIIIGCGRVGSELALLLSKEGHNVVVMDKNPEAFSKLGGGFNGITVEGSGFNLDDLKEAGIERADAIACVSDRDNANIIAAQVAKKLFGIKKVIARIYDPKREETYEELGLDVIGGTTLIAKLIKDKLIHPHFIHHSFLRDDAMFIEIEVSEELAKEKIEKIEKKEKIEVVAIMRQKEIIKPDKEDRPKMGDILVGIKREE